MKISAALFSYYLQQLIIVMIINLLLGVATLLNTTLLLLLGVEGPEFECAGVAAVLPEAKVAIGIR